jgi:beta-galactosidase GanA
VTTAKGETRNSLSPHFDSTLQADRKAFVQLMRHLKEIDQQHTVIMVQVENETGTYSSVRDYSDTAQKLFAAKVPDAVLKAMHKQPGTWSEVFGKDADEFFYAWSMARYVQQVAEAGKKEYALPMYVNVALRDPFKYQDPMTYSSGGPTWNVLDIWKAGAPVINVIAPDIYDSGYAFYTRTLEQYSRPDNALYVPESGNKPEYARYFYEVMGRGGIGFSPFGLDYTGYANFPLGAAKVDSELVDLFAHNYKLVEPMMRELAALSYAGKIWGASEPTDVHKQTLMLTNQWQAEISYGRDPFGRPEPKGNSSPMGGAMIAEVGKDEYLVFGYKSRVEFSHPVFKSRVVFARVEEGHYENGKWIFERVWNGDQTDWGLNFTSQPEVLRVKLAAY